MEAKNYEVVLCNDGFLYINKDDGNDAISKDSKCLSERDLEEIKSWIDKNHEYVRADASIETACRCYCDDICEQGLCGMCFYKHDAQGQIKNTFKYNECNELKLLIKRMKEKYYGTENY